jgi:hypothetical protein
MSRTAGNWTDAGVTAPPKDGSSYLLMARWTIRGKSDGPLVGHWDSIEGWRASPGEFGVKLLDISHWMPIPEVPTTEAR